MKTEHTQWNDCLINELTSDKKRQQYRIDGNCGLYLFVEPSGKKSWYCRYREQGRQLSQLLGIFAPSKKGHLSLIEAKAKAINIITAVKGGRPAQDANITFREVAEKWYAHYESGKRPNTMKSADNRYNKYVETANFFNRSIADIKRSEICYLFDSNDFQTKIPTAKRVYSICNKIFNFASSRGYLEGTNPMPAWEYLFPKVCEKRRSAITDNPERFGELILKIKSQYAHGDNIAGLLLFLAYCFTRPGEARLLQWNNVKADKNVIELSEDETKTATPLVIPLSAQVKELLETQRRRRCTKIWKNDYIFHAPYKGPKYPMCDAVPGTKLRQLGFAKEEQSAHGFRSCASTYLREYLEMDDAIIEMQLNHVVGTKVARIYDRSQRLDRRAEMMQRWADWVDEQADAALKRLAA